MTHLFEQLTTDEADAVAGLLGFNAASAGFRNNLRDIPGLAKPFTIGDATRAYLAHLTKLFNELKDA